MTGSSDVSLISSVSPYLPQHIMQLRSSAGIVDISASLMLLRNSVRVGVLAPVVVLLGVGSWLDMLKEVFVVIVVVAFSLCRLW